MVTTGVGKDINPQSETETNFTIFVIGIGIIAYALLIGSLSSSLQSMAHKSKAHNAQLERINQFMQFNKVPRYMQIAIKQYYEVRFFFCFYFCIFSFSPGCLLLVFVLTIFIFFLLLSSSFFFYFLLLSSPVQVEQARRRLVGRR
jgi:hypothetical protein